MLVSRRHPPRHHMGPGAVVGASVVRPPRHSRCGSGGPRPRASPQRGAEAPTAVAGGAAGAAGAAPRAVLSPRALLTSQLTPRGFKPQNRAALPVWGRRRTWAPGGKSSVGQPEARGETALPAFSGSWPRSLAHPLPPPLKPATEASPSLVPPCPLFHARAACGCEGQCGQPGTPAP